MAVVDDGRRARRKPGVVRAEDVLAPELLDDPMVDREYLAQVFRDPRKFLPPPRVTPAKTKPEPAREPEHPVAKWTKLAGLVLSAGLLAGAIAVASTKQQNTTAPRASWAASLDAFALPADATPRPGNGAAAAAPPATKTPGAAPTTAANRPAAPAQPTTSAPATPEAKDAADKVAAVRNFYRVLDERPRDALSLLDPVLTRTQADSLVAAWSGMDKIRVVDARPQPDGSVLAVVTMVQHDGVHLRITQSLSMAADAPGMITEVRLLSAERLDCAASGDCSHS
ncbi:hypothetical protein [Amycolatopsis anabasis]|uniref:hypothetical protein n=1 Tax=Amycolatopsis anabasis TaxID=1840409 RepID=UPI00131DC920|nr:hypothetical protein [Amycolatopsis anabasis]